MPGSRPAARSRPSPPVRDLYQDAFNEAVFMRPGQCLTRSLVFFDNRGVDGAVRGSAAAIGGCGPADRAVDAPDVDEDKRTGEVLAGPHEQRLR